MIASTVSTPLEGGEAGHSPSPSQPGVTTPNSIDEQTATPNTKEPSLQSDTTTTNQENDDSASVVSTPKSFITKPIQTPIGTEVFLTTAYKQLLENKSTKRNPELLKLTNEALSKYFIAIYYFNIKLYIFRIMSNSRLYKGFSVS
jgi:hypothetical protein